MAKAELELKLVRLCLDLTLCPSSSLHIVGVLSLPPAGYTCPKTGRMEVTSPCILELSIK